MVAMKTLLQSDFRFILARPGRERELLALCLLVMIVDGAGSTTGDGADRRSRSTPGYGTDDRATGGSDGNTTDCPANVMMATIDGPVVAMLLTIGCIGRRDRNKAHH
jgi:hypothetical protein